jgi:myo-inositol-1(or 4)-monophosphatase
MNTLNLTHCLEAAIEAAHLGAARLEHWRKRFVIQEKSRANLVTEADKDSENTIRDYLLKTFPGHIFVGEEESFGKNVEQIRLPNDAPPAWIVDPLDGTVNYAHDVPAYCVSIGLWYQGESHVGVIYDPRMKELFTAAKGQGAYLNGERVYVSKTTKLSQALLSTGFPSDWEKQKRNLRIWEVVSEHSRSIRRSGSTALNMAYMTCGRYDGYWAYDHWPWDITAGAVLIQEAGGIVETSDGKPFDPFRMDMCATNGPIQQELLKLVNILG